MGSQLKEYKYEEVSKMEEVSEYLQEIFDKYSIPRSKFVAYGDRKFWTMSSDINPENKNTDKESILILISDEDLLHVVNKEIFNILPQLEKRSGIMLTSHIDLSHIVVRQIYRRFGRKNMYVKEEMISRKIQPKNDAKEKYIELSDYLQEFFDKFRIVEVKPGSWKRSGIFLHNTWCLLQHKDNTLSTLGYYGDKYTKYKFKIHVHVEDVIFDDVVDEIYKIQSNIEHRMGHIKLGITTTKPDSTIFPVFGVDYPQDHVGKIEIEIR